MVAKKTPTTKSKIVLTSISPKSVTVRSGMKYRPNSTNESNKDLTNSPKEKLPCAEATSVQQVITMMFVHLCRKVLYGFDVSYRVGFYVLGTLMVSVVADYKTSPASRAYLSKTDNFFNQWFVKLGWGWTLLVVGSFNYMTVRTYSCGRAHIVGRNLSRLAIATAVWFAVTSLFQSIETRTGVCEMLKFTRRDSCVSHGYLWKGFDISGHCFLLVFCNLFIIEEGKAYLGWERIKDFMRMEEHKRIKDSKELSETPLGKLKNEEFLWLRKHFTTTTPYIRLLFCLMAVFSILWDLMLLTTLLYHHLMIEKVVASGLAVLAWFSLYKFVYKNQFSPGLPGEGIFKYVTWTEPNLKKPSRSSTRQPDKQNKWSAQDDVPKFMGMPLYALKDYKEEVVDDAAEVGQSSTSGKSRGPRNGSLTRGRAGSIAELNTVRPLGRARSRSQSRSRVSISKSSLNMRW